MARLPVPGGDNGNWGDILNNFLEQIHNSDGSLKSNVVTSDNIADGAITPSSHTHDESDLTVGNTTNTAISGILVGDGSRVSGATASNIGSAPIPDAGEYYTTDTIDGALQQVGSQLSSLEASAMEENGSFTVNLETYGIVSTTEDLTATTENYHIAYQNGVGFQNAINDAISNNIKEVTIPPGEYPLCYATDNYATVNPVINACGVNINAYGCRFYVVYDDLETGLNPYYTGTLSDAHAMCGIVFLTDHDIRGCEIVGERAQRIHATTNRRDKSYAIALDKDTNGNVIKDCRLHHMSGDGIGIYNAMQTVGSWVDDTWTSVTWDGSDFVASPYTFTSPSHTISADLTRPMQIRSNYMYFIATSAPLKLHCFDSGNSYIGSVRFNQGEPFYFLPNTVYWRMELTRTTQHNTTDTTDVTVYIGYGTYFNTTIDSCEIYLNQRGGISNIPSGTVIKNCWIHHNGNAYGSMPAYYDGTQFGIDIEDWFIHRVTIENCNIYSNARAVLYRCYSIKFINSTLTGGVHSINYATDFYALGTRFKSNCTFAYPAISFGKRVAIGCIFEGTKTDEILDLDYEIGLLKASSGSSSGDNKVWQLIETREVSNASAETVSFNGLDYASEVKILFYNVVRGTATMNEIKINGGGVVAELRSLTPMNGVIRIKNEGIWDIDSSMGTSAYGSAVNYYQSGLVHLLGNNPGGLITEVSVGNILSGTIYCYAKVTPPEEEPDTTAPAAPQNFATGTVTDTTVQLTWDPNSETDLAGYNIYVDTVKNNTSLIDSTTYTVTDLTPDTSYTIEISAVDTSDNESEKASLSATTDIATTSTYYYTEGTENVAWVDGYSWYTGSRSKEADHLNIVAEDDSSRADYSYVTDVTIDLTSINTLVIDWENVGTVSTANWAYFIASTEKSSGRGTYNARAAEQSAFSRKTTSLDVSGLSGSYYIRAHAYDDTYGVGPRSEINIYNVYGTNT